MITKTLQQLTTPNIPLIITQPMCEEIATVKHICNCGEPFSSEPTRFDVIAVYNDVRMKILVQAIITYTCPHCNQSYLIFASYHQFSSHIPTFILHEVPLRVEVETLNYLCSMQKQFEPPNNQDLSNLRYLNAFYNNIRIYLAYTVFLNKNTEKEIRKAMASFGTSTNYLPYYYTEAETENIPKKYYQTLDLISYMATLQFSSATANFFMHLFLRKSEKFAEYYTPISLDTLSE